jgi:hypothetical protein
VSYVIFCTDAPALSKKMPDCCREVAAHSLGAAIDTASKLIDDGIIVWRIKGLDGLTMERDDIELERVRRQALSIKSKSAA